MASFATKQLNVKSSSISSPRRVCGFMLGQLECAYSSLEAPNNVQETAVDFGN
jgi:hypothetical protein